MNRRSFVSILALAGASTALRAGDSPSPSGTRLVRRMRLCLSPGSIGVGGNQTRAIDLACRHGFEAVEPFPGELVKLSEEQSDGLVRSLRDKGLVWGAAGLPVVFRQDEARFGAGLRDLPAAAAALRRAGVDRVGTWISPGHATLTYMQNFRRHATRLRAVAEVLKDHGQRLGLEYVGTQTSRARSRHVFIHTLEEVQDLIGEIGTGNVGVVLDSWHWWQAGDSVADLARLARDDVVSVDLNDAPRGLAKELQQDNQRELPAATGVIPVAAFLESLARMEYNGPVRAEPFNRAVNDLDDEEACAVTVAALRKALGLPV